MRCKTLLLQHLLLPRLPFLLLHVTGPMLKMRCFCNVFLKKKMLAIFSAPNYDFGVNFSLRERKRVKTQKKLKGMLSSF